MTEITPQEKAAFQVLKIAIDLAMEGQLAAAGELARSAAIAFGDNGINTHPMVGSAYAMFNGLRALSEIPRRNPAR